MKFLFTHKYTCSAAQAEADEQDDEEEEDEAKVDAPHTGRDDHESVVVALLLILHVLCARVSSQTHSHVTVRTPRGHAQEDSIVGNLEPSGARSRAMALAPLGDAIRKEGLTVPVSALRAKTVPVTLHTVSVEVSE